MNFLKLQEYLGVGDQIEVALDDNANSMYSGRLIEITDEEIVIGYNRHTDWDADQSEVEKATMVIDKNHIIHVKRIVKSKDVKTY